MSMGPLILRIHSARDTSMLVNLGKGTDKEIRIYGLLLMIGKLISYRTMGNISKTGQVLLDKKEIEAIFDVTELCIVPKTLEGVRSGCKLFGAAILRKSDLSLVVASTNRETSNPLFHGEVSAINDFYSLESRPLAKDCIFYATHEPCSLCLSAIVWGGFDNFCYFFTYEDSRQKFKIPYDIDILEEVYRVADPGREIDPARPLYNHSNKYFRSTALKQRITEIGDRELLQRSAKIKRIYDDLSNIYQSQKGNLVLP